MAGDHLMPPSTGQAPSARPKLGSRTPSAVEILHAIGTPQNYRKVLKAFAGFCLAIALTSPLTAVSVAAFYQVSYGGYFGLSWGWIIPSFIYLPQVLAVAELCSSMPVNAAFYWWSAALAPPTWSRALGFIMGYMNMFSLSTGTAGLAYALSSVLTYGAQVAHPEWEGRTNAVIMGVAFGIVILWLILLTLRLEQVSWVFIVCTGFTFIYTALYIIALPVSHAVQKRPFASGGDVFGSYTNYSDWPTGVAVPFTWFCAAIVNSGWLVPVYVVETTHDGRRNVPKAIVTAYSTTAFMGAVICLVSAFCITDPLTLATDKTGFPLYSLIIDHWGPAKSAAFFLIITPFSIVGSSGMLLSVGNQFAAFARDGGMPFSKYFAKTSKRTNIPIYSVTLLSGVCFLILLFSLSNIARQIIYSLPVITALIVHAVPVSMRIFAGDRWAPGPWNYGKFSIPIHTWALASQIYLMIMESFPPLKHWTAATLNYNWVLALGMILFSTLMYIFWGKKTEGLKLYKPEVMEQIRANSVVVAVNDEESDGGVSKDDVFNNEKPVLNDNDDFEKRPGGASAHVFATQ